MPAVRMRLGSMSIEGFYKGTLDMSHGFTTVLCHVLEPISVFLIGASLSEPHINGTAIGQVYHILSSLLYVRHLHFSIFNTDDHSHINCMLPTCSDDHACASQFMYINFASVSFHTN